MKNLILCLLLIGLIGPGHSQIVLKETRVDYSPDYMKVGPLTNSATLKITEAAVGEFQKDPLSFIQDNFDIQNLIAQNREYDFDSYDIHFKTKDGL